MGGGLIQSGAYDVGSKRRHQRPHKRRYSRHSKRVGSFAAGRGHNKPLGYTERDRMAIENFIIYWTSDDNERARMRSALDDYIREEA